MLALLVVYLPVSIRITAPALCSRACFPCSFLYNCIAGLLVPWHHAWLFDCTTSSSSVYLLIYLPTCLLFREFVSWLSAWWCRPSCFFYPSHLRGCNFDELKLLRPVPLISWLALCFVLLPDLQMPVLSLTRVPVGSYLTG